jgi:bifunctional DNase/RNase
MSKSKLIRVEIADIIAPLPSLNLESIMVLKADGSKKFAVVIDNLTGCYIAKLLGEEPVPMPVFDLFISTLKEFEIKINKMVLNLKDDFTPHATIHYITMHGTKVIQDTMLSDGFLLAIRANASIFISQEAAKATIIDKNSMKNGMKEILEQHDHRCKLQEDEMRNSNSI